MITISDFIPKYPNIFKSKYDKLNPYKENFYQSLYSKKEFYDEKLSMLEVPPPRGSGLPLKHQKITARYLSSQTMYDSLLLIHHMGSGKCVLPDTYLYINNRLETAEEIWNNYRDNLIFQDEEGDWTYPKKKLYVNSLSEKDGQIVRTKVNQLYRQYIDEDINIITLQSGDIIKITKQHKLLTENGWTNDFTNAKFVSIPNVLKHINNRKEDPLLCKILAWQIGEGHERPIRYQNTAQVTLPQSDPEMLNHIYNLYKELAKKYNLELTPYIRTPQNKCQYIEINSCDYKLFLDTFGYHWGYLSKDKVIPDFIMSADKKSIKDFIQTYFDAEGSVQLSKNTIELCSKSKKLIIQLQHLLRIFEIRCRIKTRFQCATNTIKKIKRPYYYLYISGLSVRVFNKHIKLQYKYKQDAIDQICNKKSNTNVEVFPPVTPILQNIYKKCNISYLKLGGGIYVKGRQMVTKSHLEKIINNLTQIKTCNNYLFLKEQLKNLELIHKSENGYSKIVSIKQEHYKGWVYDFEILKHHNFIANGMIAHNTCSAIQTIEQIKRSKSTINGAIILAKGKGLLQNFREEIIFTCTAGEYIPENYENLTKETQVQRKNKSIAKFYSLHTFETFAKKLNKLSDAQIIREYSNKIIVIDEIHNIRIQPESKKKKQEFGENWKSFQGFSWKIKPEKCLRPRP